jgi:hypothetical protein
MQINNEQGRQEPGKKFNQSINEEVAGARYLQTISISGNRRKCTGTFAARGEAFSSALVPHI